MNRYLRLIAISGFVVVLTLAGGGYHQAHADAAPTGVYDLLTFPGASSTSCGTWALNSTLGVNQPGPSNYTEVMTDGKGNIIFSRSQAGGIGFWTFWDSNVFTAQPTANPIREYIVMDGVVIADVSANNPCLPDPVYRAVPIPEGFVLRTITCDTTVYDTPAGNPLGASDAIKAGQTWFVSPTPTVVGQTNWTEIFVSGPHDGYIPTACVGGKPDGYGGA